MPILLIVIIVAIFPISVWADKIILTNGNTLECRIIEYAPEGITIDYSGAAMKVKNSDIAQIISPAPPELKMAEDYLSKKNYKQAITQYEETLKKYNNYSYSWKEEAYFNLAGCYMEEQKWKQAEANFNNILSEFKSPKSIQKARLGLADLFLSQKVFTKAKEACAKIIDDFPKEKETVAQATYYLGESSAGVKEYKDAMISFLRVVLFYYNYPEWSVKAKFRSGEMSEALEDWARAKWTYEELIEEYPDSIYANTARAKLEAISKKGGN